MHHTSSRARSCLAIVSLAWASSGAAAQSRALEVALSSRMAPDARVRGVSSRIVAIVNDATARSQTFRALVNQINHTDGMVYIAEGDCGSAVQACLLLTMTAIGTHRMLRILVDPRAADHDLMASIGHELQHAVEVLSHRSVTSSSEMTLLYTRICNVCGPSFETNAAGKAGDAVRDELLERKAAPTRRGPP